MFYNSINLSLMLPVKKVSYLITFAVPSVEILPIFTCGVRACAKVGSWKVETKPQKPNGLGTVVFDERYRFFKHMKIDKRTSKPKSRTIKLRLKRGDKGEEIGKLKIDLARHINDNTPVRLELPMTCHVDGMSLEAKVFVMIGMVKKEKEQIPPDFEVPKVVSHESWDIVTMNKPIVTMPRGRSKTTNAGPPVIPLVPAEEAKREKEENNRAALLDSGQKRELLIEALPGARSEVSEAYMITIDFAKRVWPPLVEAKCWDTNHEFEYPPAVIPIFCAMCHSHILMKSSFMSLKDFNSYMASFFAALNSPTFQGASSAQEKFVTKLLLGELVRRFSSNFYFLPERVEVFLKLMRGCIRSAIDFLVEELLRKMYVVCRTIASAAFELPEVLTMFRKAVDDVRNSLVLPEGIKEVIMKEVFASADSLIINTIEKTPEKFTVENATIWNSTVTAIETDLHIQLTLLGELCAVLFTARQMIYDHEKVSELVTHLESGFVLKVMKHLHKDDQQLEEPDVAMYAKRFGLSLTGSYYFDVSPVDQSADLAILNSDIDLTDWRANVLDPEVIKEFPFLTEIMACAPEVHRRPSGVRETMRMGLDSELQ